MKCFLGTLVVSVALPLTAFSAPLKKGDVPGEAKWLIHFDFDRLRETQVGTYLWTELGEKALKEAAEGMPFKFSFDFKTLHSLTAYGSDFNEKKGVLLLRADKQTQKDLQAVIDGFKALNTNAPVEKLVQDSGTVYSMDNQVFGAFAEEGVITLATSQEEIEKANEVRAGKGSNLASSQAFSGYPDVPRTFFFLGVAEGFNEHAAIPPEAKILQMAEGGRIVLGENAEKLFLQVALKTKSPELTAQIQQVVQGMVALVSLSQSDNKELLQLARSTQVKGDDKTVSVSFEYPVQDAIGKLSELEKELASKHQKSARKKQEAEDEDDNEGEDDEDDAGKAKRKDKGEESEQLEKSDSKDDDKN